MNRLACRSERDANADFSRASRNDISQHAVQTSDGQDQRKAAETPRRVVKKRGPSFQFLLRLRAFAALRCPLRFDHAFKQSLPE